MPDHHRPAPFSFAVALLTMCMAACGTTPGTGTEDASNDVGSDAPSPEDTPAPADAPTPEDTPTSEDSPSPDVDPGPRDPFCYASDDPRADYVGASVEICTRIDYDCGDGYINFENACGCGCEVCSPQPHRTILRPGATDCSDIDVACPMGYFGRQNRCGCVCEITEACAPAKFRGTSGLAEPFAVGNRCEFLIACSQQPLAAGLSQNFLAEFPDARCEDGSTFGCPDGTASFCEKFIETVDSTEALAACRLSTQPAVERLICGGDL